MIGPPHPDSPPLPFNAVEVRPVCAQCGSKSLPQYGVKGSVAYRECAQCGHKQKYIIKYCNGEKT